MSKNWIAAGLALLATTAALYAVMRPNQLVAYATRPLNAAGDRVSLMVPRGWIVKSDSHGFNGYCLALGPDDRRPWLLRRLGIGKPEETAVVSFRRIDKRIFASNQEQARAESVAPLGYPPYDLWQSSFVLFARKDDHALVIQYLRSDKSAFEATHAAIFRSARIIPSGSTKR